MGLLDKMKNLFTDEVEEEPIKSEKISVEIPAPAKMEATEKVISEPETKLEEPKLTPIFFDDEYFKELEQPKPKEVKSSYMKESVKQKEEKKIFKPTPIISPVYGVLDKNYNKEDIKAKKDSHSLYDTNIKISIDDVRKKAFGTLEDELETTLFGNNSILFNSIEPTVIEEKEDDLFEELIEPMAHAKEEDINIVEEEMDKDETLIDSELFDLIDSMYEKGE